MANVVVIVAASPIIAAVVGRVFFGERTNRRTWIAIGITVCGVVVVVSSSIGSPNLVGDLLALTAVAAFSTNMNVWRRYREQSRFIGLSIAASVTIVITVWFAAPFGLSAQVYLAAIGMGLLFNPIGRLCLTSAPRHAPASEVALFTPVETLAASAWAWIAFSEQPSTRTFLGGAVIFLGLLYGTVGRQEPSPSLTRVSLMPKVFVHGNPECSAVWDLLVAELADRSVDDVVRLSPPGFGAPVPDGFEATMAGYHAWLVAELEAIDGPIDLVGHDWGTGHVAGIAADRPDLIRSFAMDCGGLVHPDYVWHDMAQAGQPPEVGEQVVAKETEASRADRWARLEGLGMPGSIAEAHADAVDEAMGACVLTLYRSAVPPALPELGARLRAAARRPALFVIAEQDPYVPADLAASTAGDLGGTVVRFADQGHWWMIGAPAAAANALVDFWSSLD